MDDLPVVDVLHTKANLSEPVQNLILREWSSTLFFDSVLEVTA